MQSSTEQVTIRIDNNMKIIKVDTTLLRPQFATYLTKEVGHGITDIVHPQDRQRLLMHLKEVNQQGQTDAQITNYRLLVNHDFYVHTKVQSRMFRSDVPGEPDFVMAIHELLADNDTMNAVEGGSFSGMIPNMNISISAQRMIMSQQQAGLGIGGPLIGSQAINGGSLSQISPRNSSLLNDTPMIPAPTYNDSQFFQPEFDLDFISPAFDIDNQLIDSRPESRTSMGSVSTPRPSSATAAFSPATAPMCPSPLTPYSQPSPASITNNNNTTMTNNNLTNTNTACGSNNTSSGFNSAGSNHSGNFQFNFEEGKEKVQEQLQKIQQQQENNTSERLRNLLMKSPSASEDELQRKNQILKVLVMSLYFFVKNL